MNVAEHAALQQSIDSNKAYTDQVVDSNHAWAVSQFDSTWNAIQRID